MNKSFTNSKHIGAEIINNHGSRCKVIEVLPKGQFIVKFDNGYVGKFYSSAFFSKQIKSPYCKSVFGVGYLGEGDFIKSKGKILTKEYIAWSSMLRRCYSDYFSEIRSSYKDCFVCNEWHNFQNFAKWYSENYYEIKDEKMCLDKDILMKNNKEYSENNCCIVPNTINTLFVNRKKRRGKYLIGVVGKPFNKYVSAISKNGKIIGLGYFNTEEQAFLAYKIAKEKYLKEIAFKYINDIPHNIYMALINYKIEMGD